MNGTFVWTELATTDVERAKAFYSEMLGWTFEAFELPDGPYWVAKSRGTVVGGLGGMDTSAVPGTNTSQWFSFIEVDDVDARLAKAVELGGNVVQSPTDVPNVGRVAVLRDPTGAAIGLMTGIKPHTASPDD